MSFWNNIFNVKNINFIARTLTRFLRQRNKHKRTNVYKAMHIFYKNMSFSCENKRHTIKKDTQITAIFPHCISR